LGLLAAYCEDREVVESAEGSLAQEIQGYEDLLRRVGMISAAGDPRRSDPPVGPPAFVELSSRLTDVVDERYDLIVVRDLFGDRVLGYQLALTTRLPVAVSSDLEGIVQLEGGGSISNGSRALIAADVHFTTHSIQAAAFGIEQAGLEVAGVAVLIRITRADYLSLFGGWKATFSDEATIRDDRNEGGIGDGKSRSVNRRRHAKLNNSVR
jgi:hypothetical protein